MYNAHAFRQLVESMPIGVIHTDSEGRAFQCNEAFCKLTGLSQAEALGEGWKSAVHPEDREATLGKWNPEVPVKGSFAVSTRFLRPDGRAVHVSGLVRRLEEGGEIQGFVGALFDVTEFKLTQACLEENEIWLRSVLDSLPAGLFHATHEGSCTYVNSKWTELSGMECQEAQGEGWLRAIHPSDLESVQFEWHDSVASGRNFDFEFRFLRPDGVTKWVHAQAAPLMVRGYHLGFVGSVTDVTAAKESETIIEDYNLRTGEMAVELAETNYELERLNIQLETLATTDGLTGLYNHKAFQEHLRNMYQSGPEAIGLIMVDADNFKAFNDEFGHPAGDEVLKSISAAIKGSIRLHDFPARYGGEEFVVVVPNGEPADTAVVAERIRRVVELHNWPHRPITVSVGFACAWGGRPTFGELIQNADQALYAAKQQGKNCVVCWSSIPKAA